MAKRFLLYVVMAVFFLTVLDGWTDTSHLFIRKLIRIAIMLVTFVLGAYLMR